jgi:cytochrome P450 family 9
MWLPFGIGNRNCIGMRLALLEAKVAIFKLIKEFRFEPTENTIPPVSY